MYKQIPGWSNYVINEDGVIVNTKLLRRYLGWIGNTGYRMVRLFEGSKTKDFCIHTLMSLAFFNFKPTFEMCINHKDANKLNNNISNLEIVTQQENRDHAKRLGLYKPAIDAMSKSHKRQRKLVAWQVRKIRKEYVPRVKTFHYFADLYGVSNNVVQCAYHGRTWQEIKKTVKSKKK